MYEMEGASPSTPHQVSQLPSLPGPAGRPLVPHTRGRYRFPDSYHVP
jgi:hypothetical protein